MNEPSKILLRKTRPFMGPVERKVIQKKGMTPWETKKGTTLERKDGLREEGTLQTGIRTMS